MARMMVYSEANSVLETSLSPLARCLTKKVAIDNHAAPASLSAYVDSRLVPASMVALIQYSVTFKDWDNTILKSGYVNYGHQAVPPADPYREGYSFSGWDPSNLTPSADTVYKAQYTELQPDPQTTYQITFVDYDDATLETKTVQRGVIPQYTGATLYREGFTFDRWDPVPYRADKDQTYKAVYEHDVDPNLPGQYTVNWYYDYQYPATDSRNFYKSDVYNSGDIIQDPGSPQRNPIKGPGYRFVDWYGGTVIGHAVTSNMNVFGEWRQADLYSVTFYVRLPGEQQWDILQGKDDYEYGDPLTAPTPQEISGYTFSGWGTQVPATVTSDMKFYGHYEPVTPIQVTVRYDFNGGYIVTSDGNVYSPDPNTGEYVVTHYEYGTTFYWDRIDRIPVKDGYVFDGWTGCPGHMEAIYQDCTATAVWKAPEQGAYNIYWYVRDPDTLTRTLYHSQLNASYGDTITLPSTIDPINTISNPQNYMFTQWLSNDGQQLSIDGSTGNYIAGTVVGDQTFDAVFYEARTITFKNWDGTVLQQGKQRTGQVPVYTGPTPTKGGATWTGWDKQLATIIQDEIYTATFQDVTYTISFIDYDDSPLQTLQVTSGQMPTPQTPTRQHYTFSFWNPTLAVATADQTYKAVYTNSEYYIRFLNGNTVLQEGWVTKNATPSYTGSTPTKAGATFSGWSPTLTAVVADQDYYAQFNDISYTIRFLNYDGSVLQSDTYTYGQTPSYTGSTPTKPDTSDYTYTFSGWSPSISTVTGNQDYTAQFTETLVVHKIRFYEAFEMGSSVFDAHLIDSFDYNPYGFNYAPSGPTHSGYRFTGWQCGNVTVGSSEAFTASGPMDFTATYEQIQPGEEQTWWFRITIDGGAEARTVDCVCSTNSSYNMTVFGQADTGGATSIDVTSASKPSDLTYVCTCEQTGKSVTASGSWSTERFDTSIGLSYSSF